MPPHPRSMVFMLWSDPRDEPPEELRSAEAMFRRLRWLLPIAVLAVLVLLHVR